MIPKYITLKEKINEEILQGNFPLGSKLPTENQLASQYKVSRSTIRQALELLEADGIIAKKWGSGNTIISKSDNSKKKTVMLIVPDLKREPICQCVDDITTILLKNGFQIECHETKNQLSKERAALSLMLNEVYGGLLIIPAQSSFPSINKDIVGQLLKRQTPIIFINSLLYGITGAPMVELNNYSKGYQMARSLINSGHKKLGGVFIYDDMASVKSFSGFTDAIRDANLEIFDDCFLWCNSKESTGSMNRFFKHAISKVSCIYLDDDLIATDGTFPVYYCTLAPGKPLGKEITHAFLTLKKNGNCKSITIPYK
ncbi:MAG: GntR family transcriptional regulator [Pseudobutyrivibrio sp.]|nr:GntR family transcriptional regulator [Pseudobutyrivibrio sp.]